MTYGEVLAGQMTHAAREGARRGVVEVVFSMWCASGAQIADRNGDRIVGVRDLAMLRSNSREY